MTRTQSVTRTRLGDGHVVVIVDVDPAQLSPHQRYALDGLRRAVAELREVPSLPAQRDSERLAGVGEGGDARRGVLRGVQGTTEGGS